MKAVYLLAGIPVEAEFRYGYIPELCADYKTAQKPRISIVVDECDIRREREASDGNHPAEHLESTAFYRKFCEAAAGEDVVLIHSCAVAADGVAYLFAAPSGTGKSTHAALWLRLLGDDAYVINGDKPLLRVTDNRITVYGTPWDGKERRSRNTSAPVAGICFLSRGKENKIRQISSDEALPGLLSQTFRPSRADALRSVTSNILKIARTVPFYSLECDISLRAAELSYSTMRGGSHEI